MSMPPTPGASSASGSQQTSTSQHTAPSNRTSMVLHELLLRGEVPFERHHQVLSILAGVARHQPVRIFRRGILYEPLRDAEEPGTNLRRGGTQNVAVKPQTRSGAAPALYYTKLMQELSEDDFGAQNGGPSLSANVPDDEDAVWSMRWEDVPDTGERGVSVTATNTTELRSGNPHAFMLAEGPNKFLKEFYIEGHNYCHENVNIFLYRVLHDLIEPDLHSAVDAPRVNIPKFESLKLLDPSGGYTLDARVRVLDFNDSAVLERGVKELKAFQAQMDGCVELSIPDRNELDTRVKYQPPQAPATTARPR